MRPPPPPPLPLLRIAPLRLVLFARYIYGIVCNYLFDGGKGSPTTRPDPRMAKVPDTAELLPYILRQGEKKKRLFVSVTDTHADAAAAAAWAG